MKYDFNFFLFVLAYTVILLTSLVFGVAVIYCVFMLIKFVFENVFKFVSQWWLRNGRNLDTSSPIYDVVINLQKKKEEEAVLKHFPAPEQYKRDRNKSTILCVICLEDLKDGEVYRCLPQCNHIFHETCVKPWLMKNKSCPICRLTLLV